MRTVQQRCGHARSRPRKARSTAAVTALLLAASLGATSACSAGSAANKASSSTIVVGQAQNITDFNPWSLKDYSYNLQNQLFDTLIRYDSEGKPQPRLAKSWDTPSDGKSVTLHLRDGVKFHNGDPFTAADVAFSIKSATDPANVANIAPLAKLVSQVDTPDDRTVVLHYKSPNPAALDLLDLLYIADHAQPDKVLTSGNGTGPFTLAKFEPGQGVTLKANDAYWGQAPKVSTIQINVVPDMATLVSQLKTGSVDLATGMAPQNMPSLRSDSSLTTGFSGEGQNYLSFAVNAAQPPTDNIVVRQALSYALDRNRIATEVVGPGADAACLPYPKTSLGYSDDLAETCKFDLAKAKALLQQAGVPNLSLTIQTSTSKNPEFTQMSQIFQADLKKIGVDAKIQDLDETTFAKNRQKGAFEVEAGQYGRAGGDPATMFGSTNAWQVGHNASQFVSDDYAREVKLAGSTLDKSARKTAYHKINEIILQQNFVLMAAANTRPWASSNKLQDVLFDDNGLPILDGAHF